MKPTQRRFVLIVMSVSLFPSWSCVNSTPGETTENFAASSNLDSAVGNVGEVVGTAPAQSQGSPSVILLRPHHMVDVPIPNDPAVMDQFGREFIPRLLVAREGQAVLFKNSEDELHTVHVQDDAGESLFNVAMPIQGGEHSHTFDKAGDYDVTCNAHPEMHATILVVTNPYATVADRYGSFSLSNVAPGTYDLIIRQSNKSHKEVVQITPGLNELHVDFPS